MRSDDLAAKVLMELGFEIQKLPTSGESGRKTPDFLVYHKGSRALIEAKLKVDDLEKANDREETLAKGDVYVSDHVRGRDETLSAIVGHGNRQLRSANTPSDYKILLFLVDCINSNAVTEQLIDTLYGRTTVVEVAKNATAKPCYFYRNSDFFRRRELDAVIIGCISQGKANLRICLNPYAGQYTSLKGSDFILPFGKAVLDPMEEEKSGRAYIPDPTIERKEQAFTKAFPLYDPMLRHLANKYQTAPLTRVDFNSPEITIRSKQH